MQTQLVTGNTAIISALFYRIVVSLSPMYKLLILVLFVRGDDKTVQLLCMFVVDDSSSIFYITLYVCMI